MQFLSTSLVSVRDNVPFGVIFTAVTQEHNTNSSWFYWNSLNQKVKGL